MSRPSSVRVGIVLPHSQFPFEYERIYEGGYQRILEKYGGPFRFKER